MKFFDDPHVIAPAKIEAGPLIVISGGDAVEREERKQANSASWLLLLFVHFRGRDLPRLPSR